MSHENAFDFDPAPKSGVPEHRVTPRSRLLGHPMTSPSGQTTETRPRAGKIALHGAAARSYTQPVPVRLVGRF